MILSAKHAWKELRHDQKWCDLSAERSSKRRKGEDGPQSSTAHANEDVAGETVERPPGVKAAKRSGKKPMEEGKGREEFDRVWAYKQQDLSRREKLSKIGLLDRLLARTEPLPDYEETLKKKLINELFSTMRMFLSNGSGIIRGEEALLCLCHGSNGSGDSLVMSFVL
ncbi:glutathione S-transferase T3-like [Brassica napus]|uniref:glutathione S-transferase T3-like n=1 Tax=Brassica napus TaxID=3708 RepID=UPI002079001A|nr:glutathione S-transferase T3-like [Brassica napus]